MSFADQDLGMVIEVAKGACKALGARPTWASIWDPVGNLRVNAYRGHTLIKRSPTYNCHLPLWSQNARPDMTPMVLVTDKN